VPAVATKRYECIAKLATTDVADAPEVAVVGDDVVVEQDPAEHVQSTKEYPLPGEAVTTI
jgi:hypothetical protein